MEQKKLPADPSVKTLGIISLILSLTSCCCGFLVPLAIILSIIGFISANKSLKEYQLNAENYYPQSRSNVYTGKVLNIISLIISCLYFLLLALYFLIYGTFIFSEFSKEYQFYQEYNNQNNDYYYDDDYLDEQETENEEYNQESEQEDFLYPYGA